MADFEQLSTEEGNKFQTILIAVAIGGVLFLSCVCVFCSRWNEQRMRPLYQQHESVSFQIGSRTAVVDDRRELAQFLNEITSSKDIDGHHSHPVDSIVFFFPEDSTRRFAISPDSQKPNEFWLEAVGSSGQTITTLKQFSSEPLAQWLRKHDLLVR